MFEQTPDALRVNPAENPETVSPQLYLAVFDLAQRAFVSARFDTPALLSDQPTPGHETVSRRIESFHKRHRGRHALPPLKAMGFVTTEDTTSIAAAVQPVYGHAVDFREFTLRRYDLDDFYRQVQARNNNGDGTHDTAVIETAFDQIAELRRFR